MDVKKTTDDKKPPTRGTFAALPAFEIRLYMVIHICNLAYITYCVYKASRKYAAMFNYDDFEPGWNILNVRKEIPKPTWVFYRGFFWTALPWTVGYILISQCLVRLVPSYRVTVTTLFAVLSFTVMLGWQSVIVILLDCLLMYMVSYTGSRVAIWTTTVGLLYTVTVKPFTYWTSLVKLDIYQNAENDDYLFASMIMVAITYISLRSKSFCLDRIRNHCSRDPKYDTAHVTKEVCSKEGNVENETVEPTRITYTFTDMLVYVLYQPLFFNGPFISYDEFYRQIYSTQQTMEWTKKRVFSVLLEGFRILGCAIMIEFLHHFLYTSSLLKKSIIKRIDLWTLNGAGFWSSIYFFSFYNVEYRLSALVAKTENVDAPKGPNCIAYSYSSTDNFKFFDRGMYDFMKRYIYIPIGNLHTSIVMRYLGSVACFLFSYYWHGMSEHALLWVTSNFVGVTLESVVFTLNNTQVAQSIQRKWLTPFWVRRLQALCLVPFFVIRCYTAFSFFDGSLVGFKFLKRTVIKASPQNWLVLTCLSYCSVQTGMEVKRKKAISEKIKED